MTKACICQICNCGRHRCPHNPTSVINKSGRPCLLSEYAEKYPKHPLEMRQPFKPDLSLKKNSGTIEDKTTNRLDYVNHPLEKPYVRPGEVWVPPKGAIDGLTSYKKDFTLKQGSKAKPLKKDYTRKFPGKFEGEPTYKNDYRKWAINPNEIVVHQPDYRPPEAPFEGESNYTTDFRQHPGGVRSSMKPLERAKVSDEPFAESTNYKHEYVRHSLPTKFVHEKEKYAPTQAPLDDLSSYKQAYVEKSVGKQPSCKPEGQAYKTDAAFVDDTTNKADYKRWAVPKPFVHEPETWVKPDGVMESGTTTHDDYNRKPMQRVAAVKPAQGKRTSGKFDGTTNYKEDFRKWQQMMREPINRAPDYSPPSAPFGGESNYTTDFKKHPGGVRSSMKPNERAKISDEPFADKTNYKNEYVRHDLPERYVRERAQYAPNQAPLDDLSSYKQAYVEKCADKQPSCKPEGQAYKTDAAFVDDTTNKADYKRWPTERPFVHEHDAWVKPSGQIDLTTTHQLDYVPKPSGRQAAYRPASGRRQPARFEGASNYKTDFRRWQLGEQVKAHAPVEYAPPTAPFHGSSDYTDSYVAHAPQPLTESIRPTARGVHSNAPFDGHTMYRQEFTAKEQEPCPAALLDTARSRYIYREQTPTGHKWYEPAGSKVNAATVTTTPLVNVVQETQGSRRVSIPVA